ncbi:MULTISPECIES: hypothetical protein [Bacillaceae]|uniref:Uncharacterized protein n=1 Tax=Evansella alkalicola TaxID=745819 RepID=A0ABS6JZF8_9BACI|nr:MULTISPECIES: hypothetical protein [Bacillaceae]MBU9723858.1 hypothetical protein [Bacillus alkalicola]
MLVTPLGQVRLFVNDEEIEYTVVQVALDRTCRNVSGRYLIQYEYTKDDGIQKIRCCLPSVENHHTIIESGERLEAISFYDDSTKLTIGIEASFGLESEDSLDYSGSYLSNGIEYETNLNTVNKIFQFGVCWIRPFTDYNEQETWFGADPTLIR